jgi:hypothetical protein
MHVLSLQRDANNIVQENCNERNTKSYKIRWNEVSFSFGDNKLFKNKRVITIFRVTE